VGSYLGWHSNMCWPLRGGRGTQCTQKPLKVYRKKNLKGGCIFQNIEDRLKISTDLSSLFYRLNSL
jgi:hypothetical protein